MTKTYKDASITLTDGSTHGEKESDYFFPVCPKCENTYLHHGAISVYFRTDDFSPTGVLSICADGNISSLYKAPMDNSPSRRRDGLAIEMECEVCGPVGRLTIAQHKGQTLIGWQK
jgi:hypothetical protein